MNLDKMIFDVIRSLLWFLATAALAVFDMLYQLIQEIATIDISKFSFIWEWWGALCLLLFMFIVIRMVIHFVRALVDDDILERFDPIKMIMRIAAVGLILALLPTLFGALSSFSSAAVSTVTSFTGTDRSLPSQVIVDGANDSNDKIDDWRTININSYNKQEKKYNYFNKSWQMIFVTIAAGAGCFVVIMIGLQIAQRLVGLAFKILLSPYALSGIVDPNDKTWGTWCKLVLADLLTNFYQMMLMLLALTMSASLPGAISPIARVIFFLGALMAVMQAPSGVAQIIGSDIGVGTAMQQMQSVSMMGNMAKSGTSALAAGIGLGAAASFYGAGRVLGGKSLLNGENSAAGGGGLSGGAGGYSATGGFSGGSYGASGAGGSSFSAGTAGGFSSGSSGGASEEESMASGGGVRSSSVRSGSFSAGAGGYAGGGLGGSSMLRSGSLLDNTVGRNVVFGAKADASMKRVGGSLYQMSAQRLSRPVQHRAMGGSIVTRDSRIVQASHAAHAVKNDFTKNNSGEDEEE